MTIQVTTQQYAKSKKTLQDALNTTPERVLFLEPSIFNEHDFNGAMIEAGRKFPVVMDHPKRMRFALVVRKADGTFKVS
jgi:hypothetical protein